MRAGADSEYSNDNEKVNSLSNNYKHTDRLRDNKYSDQKSSNKEKKNGQEKLNNYTDLEFKKTESESDNRAGFKASVSNTNKSKAGHM